jgi:NAD kinase
MSDLANYEKKYLSVKSLYFDKEGWGRFISQRIKHYDKKFKIKFNHQNLEKICKKIKNEIINYVHNNNIELIYVVGSDGNIIEFFRNYEDRLEYEIMKELFRNLDIKLGFLK